MCGVPKKETKVSLSSQDNIRKSLILTTSAAIWDLMLYAVAKRRVRVKDLMLSLFEIESISVINVAL